MVEAWGISAVQFAMGAFVLVLGIAAYAFKARNQIFYGAVELIFAGVAGIVQSRHITTMAELVGALPTLVGSVYVVSRGMSNLDEGMEKKFEKMEIASGKTATTNP